MQVLRDSNSYPPSSRWRNMVLNFGKVNLKNSWVGGNFRVPPLYETLATGSLSYLCRSRTTCGWCTTCMTLMGLIPRQSRRRGRGERGALPSTTNLSQSCIALELSNSSNGPLLNSHVDSTSIDNIVSMVQASKSHRDSHVIQTENQLTLYQPMTHICVMSSHKPI